MTKTNEIERRNVNIQTDTKPGLGHQLIFEITKEYIKGKRVLDIGCWTGQYEWFAKKVAKEIIGIDPSEDAIKMASSIHKPHHNLTFETGIAENLNFPKNAFEVVVMLEVLEHIPQESEERSIKEVSRVLKKGGTFILSTPNNHPVSILLDPAYFLINHRHYSEKHLKKLFEKYGFHIQQTFYKGGLIRLLNANIALICKHLLGKRYNTPKWIRKLIAREYNREGFAGIIIIGQKK